MIDAPGSSPAPSKSGAAIGIAAIGAAYFAAVDQHGFTGAFTKTTPIIAAVFLVSALLSITLPKTAVVEP